MPWRSNIFIKIKKSKSPKWVLRFDLCYVHTWLYLKNSYSLFRILTERSLVPTIPKISPLACNWDLVALVMSYLMNDLNSPFQLFKPSSHGFRSIFSRILNRIDQGTNLLGGLLRLHCKLLHFTRNHRKFSSLLYCSGSFNESNKRQQIRLSRNLHNYNNDKFDSLGLWLKTFNFIR